jgi:TetR/AcrR family transcriptional regulator, transcriptional repressor for nem operon
MSPQPSNTQQKLVDAAMDLFAYHGYGPTGLSQIAKQAGVNAGSLYHFFPTKEDLLAAVLRRRHELLWPEVLRPIWDKVDDPIERVFALMDGYRKMLAMTEFAHGCPIGNLAIELCETHPASRDLIRQNFDNWLRFVEESFQAAQDRLPTDTSPKQLAVFVLTTMEGAVMLARTYRSFEAYDAAVASLRDYVERLIADETDWKRPRTRGAGRH